ncbi:unnamed protein product, partial [Closterium sp. NIES-54]
EGRCVVALPIIRAHAGEAPRVLALRQLLLPLRRHLQRLPRPSDNACQCGFLPATRGPGGSRQQHHGAAHHCLGAGAGACFMAQVCASWRRCVLHGAGVCFMAQVCASWRRCVLHGAGVCFMAQ